MFSFGTPLAAQRPRCSMGWRKLGVEPEGSIMAVPPERGRGASSVLFVIVDSVSGQHSVHSAISARCHRDANAVRSNDHLRVGILVPLANTSSAPVSIPLPSSTTGGTIQLFDIELRKGRIGSSS